MSASECQLGALAVQAVIANVSVTCESVRACGMGCDPAAVKLALVVRRMALGQLAHIAWTVDQRDVQKRKRINA